MKTLFSTHALVSWVFGLALLLVPAALLAVFGMTINPSSDIIARLLGGALVGLGVVSWLARTAASSEALRAIVMGSTVIATLGCLVSIYGVMSSATNALGWVVVILYGFFAVGFGMLATTKPPVEARA